jgi:hypothetical protein
MAALRATRCLPPNLPPGLFGPAWREWILRAAGPAACPSDYVVAPLLAATSALIGHARWAQETPGCAEPPHLWLGVIGDGRNGKSPGANCLLGGVLPQIERKMLADSPERWEGVGLQNRMKKGGDATMAQEN